MENNRNIIITIDGQSGCGKSSTAKAVAEALHYIYIDTGAMYRATTKYFIDNSVELSNADKVKKALGNIRLTFKFNESTGHNEIWLNDENVDREIRSQEISDNVSNVAAISEVRKAMVTQQREMGLQKRIVMDGRDIGSVVFPHADLKIFMKADLEVRAKRREKELLEKGLEADFEKIKENLAERDKVDSSREDSPLVIPIGAEIVDTSNLTFKQQVHQIVELAKSTISNIETH